MPVKPCTEGGKPGYKWGDQGKCYVYSPEDEKSMNRAKQKAYIQGLAATGGREGDVEHIVFGGRKTFITHHKR